MGSGRKYTGAKKKQQNSGLGQALRNAAANDRYNQQFNQSARHTEDDQKNQGSIIDEQMDFQKIINNLNSLDNEQPNKLFKIVTEDDIEQSILPTKEKRQFVKNKAKQLRIPRKPLWTNKMTPQEIQNNEMLAFYEWRQDLSQIEMDRTAVLSPYEKNLDFWRQLWRVIELSDVLIQIVDARNPLMFYSSDLVKYVHEVAEQQGQQKQTFVILNKADFLPLELRKRWSEYFKQKGINHCFYSALREDAIIKYLFNKQKLNKQGETDLEEQLRREGVLDSEQIQVESESSKEEESSPENTNETTSQFTTATTATTMSRYDYECGRKERKQLKRQQRRLENKNNKQKIANLLENYQIKIPDVKIIRDDDGLTYEEGGSPVIVTRQELLKIINNLKEKVDQINDQDISEEFSEQEQPQNGSRKEQKFTVGTIGFPNVGKSSVINSLSITVGVRTAVGSTPGKTKYLQTIEMGDFRLCDCPGLVMPCFSYSRADFVLNGVIPVDRENDYRSYLALLCKRIPARVLNNVYKLNIIENIDKFETGVGLEYGTKARSENKEFYCSYEQLLNQFNEKHGINFGTVGKRLVKDLFAGKLLYLSTPPKITKQNEKEYQQCKN